MVNVIVYPSGEVTQGEYVEIRFEGIRLRAEMRNGNLYVTAVDGKIGVLPVSGNQIRIIELSYNA